MAYTVLAVDDEKSIVRLVQVNLERNGYIVKMAYDGVEALERVAETHPDIIVMDVMMPRMDGFETLSILRKNPETRDIPVIMLTAKAMDSDIFIGYQRGADCYLTKPFNPKELVTFVRRILEGVKAEEKDDRYRL